LSFFSFSLLLSPPCSTLFPYTTLFRSLFSTSLHNLLAVDAGFLQKGILITNLDLFRFLNVPYAGRVAFKRDLLEKVRALPGMVSDRKSTRLNSSHVAISYAVFCLKKKN